MRAVTKKCRPDWDITTPELKAAWKEGRKELFYPYGKTYTQTLANRIKICVPNPPLITNLRAPHPSLFLAKGGIQRTQPACKPSNRPLIPGTNQPRKGTAFSRAAKTSTERALAPEGCISILSRFSFRSLYKRPVIAL